MRAISWVMTRILLDKTAFSVTLKLVNMLDERKS